jgi:hypothetical protein
MTESLKIVLTCVFAAVLYGIVHDQITARICIEYFTVFHPPVFVTNSPTLLAFGWGVIATWWMGAFLGVLLAIAARTGSRPKLPAVNVLKPVMKLLGWMAGSAVFAGLLGFVLTRQGLYLPRHGYHPLYLEGRTLVLWRIGGRTMLLTPSRS